jgi:hypothetical protein
MYISDLPRFYMQILDPYVMAGRMMLVAERLQSQVRWPFTRSATNWTSVTESLNPATTLSLIETRFYIYCT